MTKTIQAWSYSRLSTWTQCPFKAKLLLIDKMQEPKNAAMERGDDIHKKLEMYMEKGGRLPKEAGIYKDMLKDIRQNRAKNKYEAISAEMQVAFNKDLKQVDWFDKDAWLRGIIDLYILESNDKAVIIDYKTGRRKNEHTEQADMYAAIFYLLNKDTFDKNGTITVKFLYVDQPAATEMLEKTYNLNSAKKHLQRFVKLGTAMTSDISFKKKPSNKCRWCHFRKANNGPCTY